MGVLEGIEESTKKKKKKGLRSNKKYTKSHKIWTPVRLKIRKGRELGGNHDM